MTADGITTTPLDSEVWYRVEWSTKDDGDWNAADNTTFDSMITAKCSIDRRGNSDEFDYRIVRVTTVTEEVRYV